MSSPKEMGNALKTICERLELFNDENLQDITNKFKELGVDVIDNEGNYKSVYDVLGELSEIWGDLSDREQSPIYETMLNQRERSL